MTHDLQVSLTISVVRDGEKTMTFRFAVVPQVQRGSHFLLVVARPSCALPDALFAQKGTHASSFSEITWAEESPVGNRCQSIVLEASG